MPGIAGIIGPGDPQQKKARLRQMVDSMMHEPFYAGGTYHDDSAGVWLGWVAHKGSFADEMPVWNEQKDVGVIFSGEDFTDLDEILSLRTRGHDARMEGASYLVHLYEEYGNDFFRKLNGRFSGMIIDLRLGRIILFNDRYGLNRVYYSRKGDGFYFASEAKSLLKVLPELRRWDPQSLGETFAFSCVLRNRSLFSGVSLLPGGSKWTIIPGRDPIEESYFRPAEWESRPSLDAREYHDALKAAWIRVLPRYLRRNEGIGLSLTGGKDSRMILAWARWPPEALPCYTFGGLYRENRDVKIAREIARMSGHSHQTIVADREFLRTFPDLAERTVYLTDGTMDVSGATELYVNRIARQIAPIRLTGNYGQEILHAAVAFRPTPMHQAILQSDFGLFVEQAAQTYSEEHNVRPLSFVAFKQLPWYHYSRLALELSQMTMRSPYLDNELVSLAYQAPESLAINVGIQMEIIAEGNWPMSRIETDRGILHHPIPVITKARRLYQEFASKAEYAYDYGMPHWLAKLDSAVMPLHLERLFLGRHKFSHYRVWYRDAFSHYVREILLDPRTRSRPYLSGPRLEAMVQAHIKGTGNFTWEIHRILTTELIQRGFIDRGGWL